MKNTINELDEKEKIRYDSDNLKLYSIKDTVEILRVSRSKVYDLINSGKLQAQKLGTRVLIRRQVLKDFIDTMDHYEGSKYGF
ncbi:helix-turn-helix domain-containing protein [Candidatus Saccharibacteria bacterium]|nr:helix-turn-helix domain-containing protein [Candidatus Saccharibacteria bacterium]